jgi:hypothetical protein
MLKFRERFAWFEGIAKGVQTSDARRRGLVVERASQGLAASYSCSWIGFVLDT